MTPPKRTAIARTLRKHDTWAEKLLWRYLRDRKLSAYKFRRQHPFDPYVLDFYCPELKVAIEIDGLSHLGAKQEQHDRRRDEFLAAHGIRTVRVMVSDIYADLEETLVGMASAVLNG